MEVELEVLVDVPVDPDCELPCRLRLGDLDLFGFHGAELGRFRPFGCGEKVSVFEAGVECSVADRIVYAAPSVSGKNSWARSAISLLGLDVEVVGWCVFEGLLGLRIGDVGDALVDLDPLSNIGGATGDELCDLSVA